MALVVKNSPANAGDIGNTDSIHGSGRSPGEGHGNPLQYSCLENPMDRGAWWATVHGVAKSQTQLKQLSTHDRVSQPLIINLFLERDLCPTGSVSPENRNTPTACWVTRATHLTSLGLYLLSLEGLMLKLKLQYFGHLMQRTDSLEKTRMLGKIEGGRRRG